jgi:hypothetical protein
MLSRTFGCVRLVWNKTLAARHRRYHAQGRRTTYRGTDAALTVWKKTEDAKNILAAGRAVSACGADVRHSGSSRVQSATKQENPRREARRTSGDRP